MRQFVGEFFAEAVGFDEHSNDLAFGGLHGGAEQARVWFHFAAALGGGASQGFAKDGLVDAQFGSDAGGPFRAQEAIREALHVGHQEIQRGYFSGGSGAVHLARACDQVIEIRRRLREEVAIGVDALFFQEFVGIVFSGKGQHANVEFAFEEKRDGAFGGGLAGGVGIVIDDDAASEAAEQFNLRLGEAGAAARDDIGDSGAGDGDGVHVTFHEDSEIALTQGFFGAIEMV